MIITQNFLTTKHCFLNHSKIISVSMTTSTSLSMSKCTSMSKLKHKNEMENELMGPNKTDKTFTSNIFIESYAKKVVY